MSDEKKVFPTPDKKKSGKFIGQAAGLTPDQAAQIAANPKGRTQNYSIDKATKDLINSQPPISAAPQRTPADIITRANNIIKLLFNELMADAFRATRRGEAINAKKIEGDARRLRDYLIRTKHEWGCGEDDVLMDAGRPQNPNPLFVQKMQKAAREYGTSLQNPTLGPTPKTGAVENPPPPKPQPVAQPRVMTLDSAPKDFSLDNLTPVEQPLDSGPVNEHSVQFDNEGKAIRPELNLPVFEPEDEEGPNQ